MNETAVDTEFKHSGHRVNPLHKLKICQICNTSSNNIYLCFGYFPH